MPMSIETALDKDLNSMTMSPHLTTSTIIYTAFGSNSLQSLINVFSKLTSLNLLYTYIMNPIYNWDIRQVNNWSQLNTFYYIQ